MTTLLAIWLGKFISFLTKQLRLGGGSAAPGLYALKIQPDLIKNLSAQLTNCVVITGTNGKTTTTRMLTHFVKANNLKVLRNLTGSNLERGVASTLVDSVSLLGRMPMVDLVIWELDEAAFNQVVGQVKPQIVVVLNALRDQLDRYGEVDAVVRGWRETLAKIKGQPYLVLNGNDPNIISLKDLKTVQPVIFKLEGHVIQWEKNPGDELEVKPDYKAKLISNGGLEGTVFSVSYPGGSQKVNLKIPGIYHIYDFLAALASANILQLPIDKSVGSLVDFSGAFGRVERINFKDKQGLVFLIKNPVGASLVFETIASQIGNDDVLLIALNDNLADGTDVSWIWDANFELLQLANKGRYKIFCTGSRGPELAVRLKYAGVSVERIVIEPTLETAQRLALSQSSTRVFILPTYTALLQLQKLWAKQKLKDYYWRGD